MNKELKDTWIAALRSGEYEQYRGAMCAGSYTEGYKTATAFCCLGVLHYKVLGLTTEAAEWGSLGLSEDAVNTCAAMNDGPDNAVRVDIDRTYSFAEIADWIEENICVE